MILVTDVKKLRKDLLDKGKSSLVFWRLTLEEATQYSVSRRIL
jgi:hypothetical protein